MSKHKGLGTQVMCTSAICYYKLHLKNGTLFINYFLIKLDSLRQNDGLGTNDLSLDAKNDIFVEFQRMVYCEAAKMLLHKQSHSCGWATVGPHTNTHTAVGALQWIHTNSNHQECFSSPEKSRALDFKLYAYLQPRPRKWKARTVFDMKQ